MKVLRLLLFPFTFIFGFIVYVRNLLFDSGILKSQSFGLPIISVGNLTVGGAGKSPVTEYLITLLRDRYKLATLSRGYGRKTHGFQLVESSCTALEAGDEPLQFKNKFPDITVAVAEKRVEGITNLQHDHEVIVLDDAYQHRWVKPGYSILLFEYEALFKRQWYLPSGNLRESLNGRRRANCIVVTKSPMHLSEKEKHLALQKIRPFPHQEVFFSYLDYGDLLPISGGLPRRLRHLTDATEILLLTGIANPSPLIMKLREHTPHVHHVAYPDHHTFTPKNIAKIAEQVNEITATDKFILTTEKDWQRLKQPGLSEHLTHLPVYYLPVKAAFHQSDKARFDQLILNYVTEHLQHYRIH